MERFKMKLTKQQLKQIIKEELNSVLKENYDEYDEYDDFEEHELYQKIISYDSAELNLDEPLEDILDDYIKDNHKVFWTNYVNLTDRNPIDKVAAQWLNDFKKGKLPVATDERTPEEIASDARDAELEDQTQQDKDDPFGFNS